MTLPNFLTFARLAAVPLIVALFFVDSRPALWAVLVLFVAAAVTDYADGWLARALDQRSELGRLMDPIADKVMVATILLLLVGFQVVGGVHLIPAIVILARELAVTGLREYLAENRISTPVTKLAKWKTATQMVALTGLIAGLLLGETVGAAGLVLLWAAGALTAITGWGYFRSGLAAAKGSHDD